MRSARDRREVSDASRRAADALRNAFPEPDGPRMTLLLDDGRDGVETTILYPEGDTAEAAYLDGFRLAWWAAYGMYGHMGWRSRRKARKAIRALRRASVSVHTSQQMR